MDFWNPTVLRARRALTMAPAPDDDPIREVPDPSDRAALRARDDRLVGCVEDAAVCLDGDRIGWVGPWDARPKRWRGERPLEVACVTPGWIDCHTHSVFAGERRAEFVQRNLGAEYMAILEAGGGIMDTVRQTRSTSRKALVEALIARCYEATRHGITTLEVKSGYGLNHDEEIKQLKAIAQAQPEVLVDLQATFLGAHVVPPKWKAKREAYVEQICARTIPEVARRGLARFCDVFCDRGVFTPDEARQILSAGLEHGLIPRMHADELAAVGAAEVAAEVGASSADHLEYVSEAAIAAMAEAGVVGVMLPLVNLYLDHPKRAPARALLEAGVEVAVATDFNPGTAPSGSLSLAMTLACTLLKMTPGEVLRGVTRAAASALRLGDDRGRLEAGLRADLTVLAVDDYWDIPYSAGASHIDGVVRAGELVYWCSAQEVDG